MEHRAAVSFSVGVGLVRRIALLRRAQFNCTSAPWSPSVRHHQLWESASRTQACSWPITVGNAPVLQRTQRFRFQCGIHLARQLAPNAYCTVNVTASPTQPANRVATLTLTDSTGTPAAGHVARSNWHWPEPSPRRQSYNDRLCLYGAWNHQRAPIVYRHQFQQRSRHRAGCRLIHIALCHHPGSSCSSTPFCTVSLVYSPTAANTAPADGNNSYGDILVNI